MIRHLYSEFQKSFLLRVGQLVSWSVTSLGISQFYGQKIVCKWNQARAIQQLDALRPSSFGPIGSCLSEETTTCVSVTMRIKLLEKQLSIYYMVWLAKKFLLLFWMNQAILGILVFEKIFGWLSHIGNFKIFRKKFHKIKVKYFSLVDKIKF